MMETPERRSPFDVLAQNARRDYRMSKDAHYNEEQRAAIVDDLKDYRESHPGRNGKVRSWENLAHDIGIHPSVLAELKDAKYDGDIDKQLALIDSFLASELERTNRLDAREFCNIGLARKMRGAINTGIRNNSCPVIIGPPGCGKSMYARTLPATLANCLFIRMLETKGDARGVTQLLYNQLPARFQNNGRHGATHTERLDAVQAFLGTHRSSVVVVDECQKLRRSGLELLRDLHDLSDLDARRNIPVVFFGDATFYRHLTKAREGREDIVAPQFVRRLHPVFDVERDGSFDDGGNVYSVEDLVRVLRNDRMKLVDDSGVRWLTMLANVRGHGMLGFAVAVAKNAYDVAGRTQIRVEHLRAALELMVGGSTMQVMDASCSGKLLAKAG